MKIVVQNFKTGTLSIASSPVPCPHPKGVLVRTAASLISVGTDRAITSLARKSYIGKALDRPDLARKVIDKVRTDGPWATWKVVRNLISEPIPLGYSLVGEVVSCSPGITDISVGDRVACAGLGYANHAEYVSVPVNLTVRVPDAVDYEQAAYTTLGAIAMQGVRQAGQQIGSTVLVVGLGLVGLLTVQICKAAGYRVIGVDLDESRMSLARQCGADLTAVGKSSDIQEKILSFTHGYGVDAVLLTAASRNNGAIFDQIVPFCRDRARVVVVGDIKMDMSRRGYFEKDLEIVQSRSYGPGRYDPNYEEKGQDYPIGYVRWTERRNMQSWLELAAEGKIDSKFLTTHRFSISEAEKAYELVTSPGSEKPTGIILNYDTDPASEIKELPRTAKLSSRADKINLGIIGTGTFAKAVLLPALFGTGGFNAIGVASARGLSASSVASRYNAEYATGDAQKILTDPSVDAVVIASRHDSHASYVVQALSQGKHVFVEKPLCLTWDELQNIREAEAKSRGALMVGFNRRFSPLIQEVKAHFEGRVEPLMMLYRINAGRIPLKSDQGWVHDPAVGGGRIIGEVCHFVDTMSAITGSRPVEVSAVLVNPDRNDLAADDNATITIRFEDGSAGTIHYWSNGDSSFNKEYLEVFGQQKIAVLDNFKKLRLIAHSRSRNIKRMNIAKGFPEEADAFRKACRTGQAAIPVESLLDTMATVLTIRDQIYGPGNEEKTDMQMSA